MSVVDGSFGHPMRLEEEASAPLAGGMMNHGFQCGMIWGASLAAEYAPEAFNTIDVALPEEPVEAPSPPVSCAAALARKMGVSEMHAVMASGFAGGLGLSGGACGALGAAIWITAMNGREEGARKLDYFNNPEYMAVIDRFVECTDCEFECAEIVGRKFEGIDDHAAYVRDGGCSEIIEALATP
ncbi:MAG: C-GCAxxG-C-C family (seleno)protein [Chloroflexota bacterium]|jgi:hypothetical protein